MGTRAAEGERLGEAGGDNLSCIGSAPFASSARRINEVLRGGSNSLLGQGGRHFGGADSGCPFVPPLSSLISSTEGARAQLQTSYTRTRSSTARRERTT